MERVLIFGGATEGREAAAAWTAKGCSVIVSVTTEYARSLLPPDTACHVGALAEPDMLDFIRQTAPDLIVDATHPYAVRATASIARCAKALGIPCQRIQRPDCIGAADWEDVRRVPNAEAAAQALLHTDGPVLLTTGSHTLSVYTAAINPARLYVRVLPTAQAIEACGRCGVLPSHIIAMQGPFSQALNAALYDQYGIRVMVTKDSGDAGGVAEKIIPALNRNIHVILIDRPKEASHAG